MNKSILLIIASLGLFGCSFSEDISYEFGLGSSEIVVEVAFEGEPPPDEVIIVAVRNEYIVPPELQSTMGDNGNLYNNAMAFAEATRPAVSAYGLAGKSRLAIAFPRSDKNIYIWVMVRGYAVERRRFSHISAVSAINTIVRMKELPDWDDYFVTYIAPVMQDYVLDQRYGLSAHGQLALGQWLLNERKRILGLE